MERSSERQLAFAAVEGEQQYSQQKWTEAEGAMIHSPAEWLLYIEDYALEARRVLSRQPDPKAKEFALHTMRKIASMAIICMEQNGVRFRTEEGARPVGFAEA